MTGKGAQPYQTSSDFCDQDCSFGATAVMTEKDVITHSCRGWQGRSATATYAPASPPSHDQFTENQFLHLISLSHWRLPTEIGKSVEPRE